MWSGMYSTSINYIIEQDTSLSLPKLGLCCVSFDHAVHV